MHTDTSLTRPSPGLARGFALLLLLFVWGLTSAEEVVASHFRYGSISYTHVSGNTVRFKVSQSWRRSAFPGSATDGRVQVGDIATTSRLEFGDGASSTISLVVTSINVAEDWFFGEYEVSHTYGSGGSFTARFKSCCRIGGLGNSGISFDVQTLVTIGNDSPVISLQPIVNLETGTATANFTIPVSDPDPSGSTTFRLSTSTELGGGSQPPGLSVDPNTGLATFDTQGKPAGTLWFAGVTVEEKDGSGVIVATTMVDFLIRVIPQSLNIAPNFDYAVTPLNGTVIQVRPGDPVSFSVKAEDADAGDNLSMNVSGLPGTAAMTPSLSSLSGNPVQSTFSWTPTNSNLGSAVMNFTAQDQVGAQTSTSVTVLVSQAPIFYGGTPANNSIVSVEPGQLVNFPIDIKDDDPADQVTLIQVHNLPGGATITPGAGTLTGNPISHTFDWTPTLANTGSNVIEFVAEDQQGDRTTHTIEVLVNARPVLVANEPLELTEMTTEPITTALLETTDADGIPGSITYTLASLPAEGTLMQGGNPLGTAGTFTQSDIDGGVLTYSAGQVNGGITTPDAFDFTVVDGNGAQIGPFTFTISILPANRPPVADAGADVTKEATDPAGTPVQLTSQSSDPDGDPLTLEWLTRDNAGTETILGTGAQVTLSFSVGVHTVIHRATETSGPNPLSDEDEVVVTITDTTPPTITLNGDNPTIVECPDTYSEPGAQVSDNGDPNPILAITGIVGTELGSYVVTYTATDASGNTATAQRTVIVEDTTPPDVTASLELLPEADDDDDDRAGNGNRGPDGDDDDGDDDDGENDSDDDGDDDGEDDEEQEGRFRVHCTASDACDTDPMVSSVMLAPDDFASFRVRYRRGGGPDRLMFQLNQRFVLVHGTNPQALWQQVLADGGVAVQDGQVIEYEVEPGAQTLHFRFDRNGTLIGMNGRRSLVRMLCTATDASGNSTSVESTLDGSAPPIIASMESGAGEHARVERNVLADEASLAAKTATAEAQAVEETAVTAEARPTEYALDSAYPNPFNPQATIGFALPESVPVYLAVYNVLGQEVQVLVDEVLPAGQHRAIFSAGQLPSGLYIYRLVAGNRSFTARMQLIK